MNEEGTKIQREEKYLSIYNFPRVSNENTVLIRNDLDAYLQKNPLKQLIIKRFIFKLKNLTSFKLINQMTDFQFNLLGDKTNFLTQEDFQLNEVLDMKAKFYKRVQEVNLLLLKLSSILVNS